MITPLEYTGSDAERINAAINAAENGLVTIPRRLPDASAKRDYWLIDSAILLRSNITLILDDCRIKLSDSCRDNIMRSANIGELTNVHIIGRGNAVLEGAEHPRSTGDCAKITGVDSYGTDTADKNENPYGDWRNIGILLVNTHGFTISNITLKDMHCWALSLEYCSNGVISDIHFEIAENRIIDGQKVKVCNCDGIDLRAGCRNITIDNISGYTGDDVIALTGIDRGKVAPNGHDRKASTMFTHSHPLPGMSDDICFITINNVHAYSEGGHQIVRLLNTGKISMHHIIINDIVDTSPETLRDNATVKIGDSNPAWGGVNQLGNTYAVMITGIRSSAKKCIVIAGTLCDSIIGNVDNLNPDCPCIDYLSGTDNTRNIFTFNLHC